MIDLKSLRRNVEMSDNNPNDHCKRTLVPNSDLTDLLDRLEAAEKDAARYQWVSLNATKIHASFLTHGDTRINFLDWSDSECDLDTSIDAAMASK